ncbi:MAG: DsbA family protein [Phycisphaerales bacterium]|nr:DsbA family protein [Phycisphaerales bacterium]
MGSRRIGAILSLMAAVFMLGGMDSASCPTTTTPVGGNCGTPVSNPPSVIASDHVLGESSATVLVVEYSDLQCPFCGSFDRNQFPTLKSDYIDTGKVRFVYRHFPLTSIHADAERAALASECAADQDMFFEYIGEVFSDATRQQNLSAAVLREIADEVGLDLTAYDACIAADAKGPRVDQDVNSGNALGVSGTPSFFVNGILTNASGLFDVIDCELAKNGG